MSTSADLFTPAVEPVSAPQPGSPDARSLGCRCPAWLNGWGDGLRLAPGRLAAGMYLTDPECRLHAPL